MTYANLYLNRNTVWTGASSHKTHPLQAKFASHPSRIYLHAEIDAIVQALRTYNIGYLEKAWMIVRRVRKDGSLSMAKPCLGCQRALIAFGIRDVQYTNWYGDLERLW